MKPRLTFLPEMITVLVLENKKMSNVKSTWRTMLTRYSNPNLSVLMLLAISVVSIHNATAESSVIDSIPTRPCTDNRPGAPSWYEGSLCRGNVQTAVDLPTAGVALVQNSQVDTYESLTLRKNWGFGTAGWRLSIDSSLIPDGDKIRIIEGDGSIIWFESKTVGDVTAYFSKDYPLDDDSQIIHVPGTLKYVREYRSGVTKVYQTLSSTEYLLDTITDRNNNTITLVRGNPNKRLITSITTPKMTMARITYDSNNRATQITDAANNSYSLSYSNGQLELIRYPKSGLTWLFSYSGASNFIIAATSPQFRSEKRTYYKNGTLATLVDPANKVTTISYSPTLVTAKRGVLSYRELYSGGTLIESGSDTSVVQYKRDAKKRVIESFGDLALKTTYTYDNNGYLHTITNANNQPTIFNHDGSSGNLVSKSTPGLTSAYTYADNNNPYLPTTITTTAGQTTRTFTYTYDPKGNTTASTAEGVLVFSASYNFDGSMRSYTDAAGNTTNYSYDGYGNVIKATDSDGNVTTYTYDPVQLGAVKTVKVNNITQDVVTRDKFFQPSYVKLTKAAAGGTNTIEQWTTRSFDAMTNKVLSKYKQTKASPTGVPAAAPGGEGEHPIAAPTGESTISSTNTYPPPSAGKGTCCTQECEIGVGSEIAPNPACACCIDNNSGTPTPPTEAEQADTNQDGSVTPVDVLAIINYLNARGSGEVPERDTLAGNLDRNGDGQINPSDVLLVINYINRLAAGSPVGEGESSHMTEEEKAIYRFFELEIEQLPSGLRITNISAANWCPSFTLGKNCYTVSTNLGDFLLYYTAISGSKILHKPALGWKIIDGTPAGAKVYETRSERTGNFVVNLIGSGLENAFQLGDIDGSDWEEPTRRILKWQMRYGQPYVVTVVLNTSAGLRYLQYTPEDVDRLGTGSTVHYGLGTQTTYGQWVTVTRDLQADLAKAQATVNITNVNSFRVQGPGEIAISGNTLGMLERTTAPGWKITDAAPLGATATEVWSREQQDSVVRLNGSGSGDNFRLNNFDGSNWVEKRAHLIEWRMKAAVSPIINVEVSTTAGPKVLAYTAINTNSLGSGSTVHHGIGTASALGEWVTIRRDLAQDLADSQPTALITNVDAFSVQGNLEITGVRVLERPMGSDSLAYDADDKATRDKVAVSTQSSSEFALVFAQSGSKEVLVSDSKPVDPTKGYQLSGVFKSLGTTQSKVSFGLASFDQNGRLITDADVLRIGNAVRVSSVSGTKITLLDSIGTSGTNKWYTNTAAAYYRSIGIYYDGVTTKLPDYVVRNDSIGGYKSASSKTITLNSVLPAEVLSKIRPSTTRLLNHYVTDPTAGPYHYVAATKVSVPLSWTRYAITKITGEGWGNSGSMFRFGTRSVKVALILNHGQTQNEKIAFDQLSFGQIASSTIYDAQEATSAASLARMPAGSIVTDGTKAYLQKGPKTIIASEFIPVDPQRLYRLSGSFKSKGTKLSKLFFGLVQYDQTKTEITAPMVLRRGSNGVVTSVSGNTINVDSALIGWFSNTPTKVSGYYRSLGFYNDGKTSQKPDYLLLSTSSATDDDAGKYVTVAGKTIILTAPLNREIAPGTIVKNHYTGDSYTYFAALNNEVPKSWTTYQQLGITGEGFMDSKDQFRLGTRYVRVILLLNWGQSSAESTVFDNIEFKEMP